MDWFAQTEYAATGLVAGRLNGTVSAEEALKHPVVAAGYIPQRQDGYLHLSPTGYDTERDPSGWKFHLSVDPTQIKEAFNHIAPDLMKEGIFLKVAEAKQHEGLGDAENNQKGKGIVIYAKEGQDITPILKGIEQKLTEAGIRPGPSVNEDKKLGGSNFLFYRNDRDLSGNYVPASTLQRLPADQRFNPGGKPDPYQNLDVSPAKPALKPAVPSADAIKFPGEHATAEEHLKYLVDITKHIADSQPPADERYRQRVHGEGVIIGDPQKPAALNASYLYGNRALASISYPDYMKVEYGIKVGPTGAIEMAKGISNIGIATSLQVVLASQGIQIEGGETKVGHDKMSRTNYIEMDLLDKKKYDHAVAIMDAITHGRDKSPEAVMQQIKAINPTNPIRPIPGQPTHAESLKMLAEATPTPTHKGVYLGVGVQAAEFESMQKAMKQQGLQEGVHYNVKPSSLNGGNNVIALTGEGVQRFFEMNKEHHDAMSAESKKILATTEPAHTQKGTYLGVGASDAEFANIRKALEHQGFQEGSDYQIKKSSINAGNNVIALSPQSGFRVLTMQDEHNAQTPKAAPVVVAPEPVKVSPAEVDVDAHGRKLLATAEVTDTLNKGKYLGVGVKPEDFEALHKAMKQQGFEEGADYKVKPSSINNGNNVIALSASGEARLAGNQTQYHALEEASQRARAQLADPSYKPVSAEPPKAAPVSTSSPSVTSQNTSSASPLSAVAAPAAVPTAAPTAGPSTQAGHTSSTSGIVSSFNGASQMQNQPMPHNAAPTMGSLALAPEPQIQLNLAQAKQQQVVNPATAPQAANAATMTPPASQTRTATPAEPSVSAKPLMGGAGQKMDGHAGKASLAIQVASEAARGNYVAATATAAVAIAEQQGIKFVVKRVPVLGGIITAGMTLWGAGAEAVHGNFKKAGSELVGGAAETVGNIVGFGAGDALREVARKGMMMAGVKEENAPNKSGIRVAAETAYDLGKTIIDSAKLKSISKTDLAKTIQADPALPHKLNLRGQEVTLVQAMEDKTFRTNMIKNMEAEAKKNPALEPRVAALKEYGARIDAAAPPTAVAAAKPAAPAAAAPASTSAADAHYKSMSTTQLASVIQKDATLVDTVKIGKNDVLLADALKDKDFRKSFIAGLEKAQANGSELHEQIAMVKAYDTALGQPQSPSTTPTAPAAQVAQQQHPKVAAAGAMA